MSIKLIHEGEKEHENRTRFGPCHLRGVSRASDDIFCKKKKKKQQNKNRLFNTQCHENRVFSAQRSHRY